MLKILVVGATGVAGGAVTAACLKVFNSSCSIVGTTSRSKLGSIPEGLSCLVMKIDVSDPNWLKQVLDLVPGPYDFGFLAFARGEVGFPAREATRQQVRDAHRLSLAPLLEMESSGQIGTVVGFSSFDELPIMSLVYGAMISAKRSMEHWVMSPKARPGSRYVVKSGAFLSQSLRGVKVYLTKQLRRRALLNSKDGLVKLFGDGSGDLQEKLLERVLSEEAENFGTDRLTVQADIQRAVEVILHRPTTRIIAVVADKLSTDVIHA